MYTLLIAIIYLAFISLGLPDSLLGAAWSVMHQEIGASISYMGIISMVVSAGTIISSLFSDKLTKKYGTQWITTISVFLTSFALLGFSYSKSLTMIILFAIPYGFGAGAIDAALNNYVAVHYSSKHMSWLHCFWGVGTIISPLVMSYSLTNATWNTGYRIISIIQFGIGIIMLLTIPIWKVNAPKAEIQAERSHSIGIIDAFKIKGVPSLLLGFFGYCAAESTAMAWSCTYLVRSKQMPEPTAAALASLFFIGMTVGSFLGGFIMDKLGDKNMIRLGTVIIFIGIALMLIPIDNTTISLIGLITIGLGCAPIYPCIIHSTPNNFGAENSGAIIGIQMASAYTGSILIPPILGVIGKYFTFNIFPIYIAIFVILMIIMTEKTFKITQK
jgi:MFS family permease